ncbi:MAG: insulinase family protein [Acidobacteriota bacterium]|nr:insulinase family protein [Acidobacteriota bacterium]
MKQAHKILSVAFVFALVFSLNFTVLAQAQKQMRVDFKETKLKNGLRVITIEDHSAPVIAISVTYNVGSRDERQGRTGFAHLFEHMMFQGSQNVGKGEHFTLVFNNGGNMNGTTNADRTNYFEALPSNQLDLALFLEADRMRALDITKENLDNQRNAVQEERRLGVDNQPYGKTDEMIEEMLFDDFPYKHSTIGSMEDLNAASVEDVAQFFKTYYAPNNAVLVLVGDFNTNEALAKIRKNFESIPSQPAPPAVNMTEPLLKAERRAAVEDQLARLTRINIAFKAVQGNTPEFYAMQVLSSALQNGQSSRLYQKLVKDRQLATSVSGYMDERRGPGGFYIQASVAPGKNPADVEAAIFEEIEKMKTEAVADWELQKAKNNTRRNFINGLQSSLNRAVQMGIYTVYYNDPNLMNTRLEKVNAVTAEQVKQAANKYLQANNRVVIVTTPKAAPRPAATGGAAGAAKN